jgi:conjugative relaxase-like TrwC/TraI family protein
VISIGRLGSAAAAADYYLTRQAGCSLDYYTGAGERRGLWLGKGARALGLTGELTASQEQLFRALLEGRGPDGQVLVQPTLRTDPHGLVDARILVTAIRDADPAALRAVDPLAWQAFEHLATRVDRSRLAHVTVRADHVARLCASAGLDAAAVYASAGIDLPEALAHVDERVNVRRPGYDVVFSTPKSVSVLYGLAGPDVADQVRQAHMTAIGQAMDYLELFVARGARGKHRDGQQTVRIGTDGLIATAFEHRASRADDPQLHTHVVVANLLRGPDGHWTAIDSAALYRHQLTAGYIYQAVLRGELSKHLGLEWTPVRRGLAELTSIPTELCREFSTRRKAIEARLAERGESGMNAARRAFLETRPAKPHTPEATQRDRWHARTVAAGYDPEALTQRGEFVAEPIDATRVVDPLLADDGLTGQRSTFDPRDVLRGVCEALPAGADVDLPRLLDLGRDVVRHPETVPLLAASAPGQRWYSTTGMLTAEATALTLVDQQRTASLGVVPEAQVDRALATDRLADEQADVVRGLTRTGAGIEVVVGPAGAGKTRTLRAARAAWEAAGYRVIGASLAAVAARELEKGAGIASTSLARFLADARTTGLAERTVLVVDEASMIGTRQLLELMEMTARDQAKLVLVGDPCQLSEIEAGGLFAALARDEHALRLTINQRQVEPWEREALTAVRDGDTAGALDTYSEHDRVRLAATRERILERLTADYLHAQTDPGTPDVLVLAVRNRDVRAINDTVRSFLRENDQLGADEIRVGGEDGRRFAAGDEVVVTRNDYQRGLLNGTRARVQSVDSARQTLTLLSRDGQHVEVGARWAAQRLDHGYAMTCHRAQGVTVDVALLYGTKALSREHAYVALSRGRHANYIYATHEELRDYDECGLDDTPHDHDALQVLASEALGEAVARSRRQRLAQDHGPLSGPTQLRPGPVEQARATARAV